MLRKLQATMCCKYLVVSFVPFQHSHLPVSVYLSVCLSVWQWQCCALMNIVSHMYVCMPVRACPSECLCVCLSVSLFLCAPFTVDYLYMNEAFIDICHISFGCCLFISFPFFSFSENVYLQGTNISSARLGSY